MPHLPNGQRSGPIVCPVPATRLHTNEVLFRPAMLYVIQQAAAAHLSERLLAAGRGRDWHRQVLDASWMEWQMMMVNENCEGSVQRGEETGSGLEMKKPSRPKMASGEKDPICKQHDHMPTKQLDDVHGKGCDHLRPARCSHRPATKS
jgi:hypothetical protein